MNIEKHVSPDNWKLPSGGPKAGPGQPPLQPLQPLPGHGGPAPAPPGLRPRDGFDPHLPGPGGRPVVPCIGLEFRPDPIEEIEQIRSSHGGEQAMALMEFPEKLNIMDSGQLKTAVKYLEDQIKKPYNADDQLLKALLNAVNQEIGSRRSDPFDPHPPKPFPPSPWFNEGGRVVD